MKKRMIKKNDKNEEEELKNDNCTLGLLASGKEIHIHSNQLILISICSSLK